MNLNNNIKKQILVIFVFITICAHNCFANDIEKSPVKKLSRHELITKSAQQCKIPCWTQAYQTQYPLCPFTACNRDYDKTMRKLFHSKDLHEDHEKQWCVDAIRGGYGLANIYKFFCPLATFTAGKGVKNFCAEGFTSYVSMQALHPRIQPCAPALPYCMLQFCCTLAIRRCDYCILDFLSNPGTYAPTVPKIEDV